MQVKRSLKLRPLAISLLLVSMGLLAPGALRAQVKKPITKDGLVKAIQLNGLSTRELVQQIQLRGVDFQLTQEIEGELRSAGALPEVVEAARERYRPSSASGRMVPGKNTPNVTAGPPLSESEIILLLQSGKSAPEIEQWVEKRGANFSITPASSKKIMAAHGTRSLVGVIAANGPGTARKTASLSPIPSKRLDYDDLTDQAINAFRTNSPDSALEFLQKAISMEPAKPTAYQLLGFVQLYGKGDIANAEKNMREAIQRGGSAVFQVKHDHSGNFRSYCEGSFFITKIDVAFKANDSKDTFEALDTNIKEIKTNGFVGGSKFGVLLGGKGDVGAFHVTPLVKINGKDNFNFSPRTEKKEEAKLIIALVNSYQATNVPAK